MPGPCIVGRVRGQGTCSFAGIEGMGLPDRPALIASPTSRSCSGRRVTVIRVLLSIVACKVRFINSLASGSSTERAVVDNPFSVFQPLREKLDVGQRDGDLGSTRGWQAHGGQNAV